MHIVKDYRAFIRDVNTPNWYYIISPFNSDEEAEFILYLQPEEEIIHVQPDFFIVRGPPSDRNGSYMIPHYFYYQEEGNTFR